MKMTKTKSELLRELIDDIPHMIQVQTVLAQLTRAKYNALVKEGFTEAQAIELSKSVAHL